MKKPVTMFIKNLRYLCLIGVIALASMAILGTGCGGGGGDGTTPTTDTTTDAGTPGDTEAATEIAASFDISGAKILLSQQDTVSAASVRRSSVDGRSLFTYEIVNQGLERSLTKEEAFERAEGRSAFADEDDAGTNLLAVDEEGNAWLAIESDYPIKVMYSVTDPEGEYVYLALDTGWGEGWDGNDYSQFIARANCAFFKVNLADNTSECVKEAVFVQNMDQDYMQRISGNQKPIQFDDDGNLFFTATEFEREVDCWEHCWWEPDEQGGHEVCETQCNYWIPWAEWNPRIYRVTKDTGEITALTQDNQSIDYFLVLPTGEVAYHSFERHGGTNDKLWMWQEGTTIDLSSSAMGNWGVDFFTIDTKNAVMWGEWNTKGVWFARPRATVGVEKAVLDTNLFGGNIHGDSKPRRVIVADDGRLYGLFESHLWDHENQVGYTVLSVYQVLPYDGVPKLELTLSDNWFWWDWMRKTPFQVSKGYLYYVDVIDPGDYLGTRDVIKMVYLPDRTTSQILDTGDARYDIYNWRLSGDILYFSALDKSTTTVVSGEIDTLKVRDGRPVEEFLTIRETASAMGAVSQIRDIEILTPQQPDTDTGHAPAVQEFHTSGENLYSVSMDFTKYMNKQSVEDNLTFVDGASNAIESMKVWIYKSLHLIPDLDGLGDSSTTTPLAFETAYTTTLGDDTKDAYGWDLADGLQGKSASFTTKPEKGWYYSEETDSAIEAISSGGVAKYAGPETAWAKETFDLGADVPDNARIEFSAKNYRWEGVNIVLWNKTEWADSDNNNDNWRPIVAEYRLGNWSNLDYKTERHENTWCWWDEGEGDVCRTDYWYDSDWAHGETPKLFNGSWMCYRIDIYGRNMKLYYSEDGTEFIEVESFSVDDLMNRVADNDHVFLLRVTDPMVIDNIQVSTLNADGDLAGNAGNILDLGFDANIEVVVGDAADDSVGLDDDLNDALNFGNW